MKYIYGTITLYGAKIPNKLQFIQKGSTTNLYTTSPTIYKAGFSLFYVGFARRY